MTTDWLGTSPLHLAALNGHHDIAEILMRSGCSKDARTKVDKTPLHLAATEGHATLVEVLLRTGAEVDSKDMVRNILYLSNSSLNFLIFHIMQKKSGINRSCLSSNFS